MRKRASLAAFFALLVSTGCSDTDARLLGPAPFAGVGTGGSTGISLHPSGLAVQTVTNSVCPSVPPLLANFNVIVAAGAVAVSVQQFRLTFTDTAGFTAPTVTLPAPVPTVQFGTALVQARADRLFSLGFPFGCIGQRTGTLVVVVVANDESGQEITGETRFAIR